MIELLIVVVILGILAAVVTPQFADAGEEAKLTALQANLTVIRKSALCYTLEHKGRLPVHNPSETLDPTNTTRRLIERTNADGSLNKNGPYGPYMNKWPANPFNEKTDIRFDGAAAGAGTHGWHYNSSTNHFSADDSLEHAAL